MSRKRLAPVTRHAELMAVALRLSEHLGYMKVSRDEIAQEAGCSPALVSSVFGTMIETRRSVMRAAIAQGVLRIVAQGLAAEDKYAMRAPEVLRKAAAASII